MKFRLIAGIITLSGVLIIVHSSHIITAIAAFPYVLSPPTLLKFRQGRSLRSGPHRPSLVMERKGSRHAKLSHWESSPFAVSPAVACDPSSHTSLGSSSQYQTSVNRVEISQQLYICLGHDTLGQWSNEGAGPNNEPEPFPWWLPWTFCVTECWMLCFPYRVCRISALLSFNASGQSRSRFPYNEIRN